MKKEIKAYMAKIGAKGGSKKSEAKTEATQRNIEKARKALKKKRDAKEAI